MNFVNFWKSRLFLNILYCSWIFVNRLFTCLTCEYLKKVSVLMWNLQKIIFIWRRRYWQIFKFALVYVEYYSWKEQSTTDKKKVKEVFQAKKLKTCLKFMINSRIFRLGQMSILLTTNNYRLQSLLLCFVLHMPNII